LIISILLFPFRWHWRRNHFEPATGTTTNVRIIALGFFAVIPIVGFLLFRGRHHVNRLLGYYHSRGGIIGIGIIGVVKGIPKAEAGTDPDAAMKVTPAVPEMLPTPTEPAPRKTPYMTAPLEAPDIAASGETPDSAASRTAHTAATEMASPSNRGGVDRLRKRSGNG
jgi:hypothetical protein